MVRILELKNSAEIVEALKLIEVDEVGIGMMAPKAHHYVLKIDSLSVPAANILKQEMLAVGGDAALHRKACDFSIQNTPCLLMGTYHQYQKVIKKLQVQPFGLKATGKEMQNVLRHFFSTPSSIQAGPYLLDFSSPLVMGILNVTPDSFSGDGIVNNIELLLKKADQFIKDGADLLDIGGESTRPGAVKIPAEEELKRVLPVIKEVSRNFSVPISIDTYKPEVAEKALKNGAHIVNDVWGLKKEPGMLRIIKEYGAPVILMHNQEEPVYRDLIREMLEYFKDRLTMLENSHYPTEKAILDPGIGFGKKPWHNLSVLKHLNEFRIFGRALLLGASRKSFIQYAAGADVNNRIPGSLASVVLGYMSGFHIFRVHDVKESKQALNLVKAVKRANQHGQN
jgi:dihydropteroate synthase